MYLVAGGYTSSSHAYLATTELLVHGHQSWVHSGALPHAAYGIRAVSLNNYVIATGHIIIIIETFGCTIASAQMYCQAGLSGAAAARRP